MDISKSNGRLFYEELRLLIKDTPEAIRRLKKICTDKTTHYIFINDHIGDMVIALGYLKAFREENAIQKITLIVTKKFEGLATVYSDYYDNVIFVNQYDFYRTILLNADRYGQLYLKKNYPNVTIVNPADAAALGFEYLKNYPELDLHKLIKYGDLNLKRDADFISIDILTQLRLSHMQTPAKRVLFSNQARTEKGDVKALCEELVPVLKNLGYELYTNTDIEEYCIKGTRPIFLKLEELGEFITGGVFIGIRSGLHDLVAYYNCLNIALYHSDEADRTFFSVNMLPNTRARILEIIAMTDAQNDYKQIIDFIESGR